MNVNVSRGAELLDEKKPAWALMIDVDKLDIIDEANCILGQLYGTFHGGLRSLGLIDGAGFGFMCTIESRCTCSDLKCDWIEEIRKRKSDRPE